MKKKILLIEDDDLLRMGLKSIIKTSKEYCVEADTGPAARKHSGSLICTALI